METLILKRSVLNNELFPVGTIVKSLEKDTRNLKLPWPYTFRVVEGPMKGKKGQIADGLAGFVVPNTKENRIIIKRLLSEKKKGERMIQKANAKLYSL